MRNTKLNIQTKANTVKDVKLSSLLEMTKAINNNVSTARSLDINQVCLENRLKVGKLVFFSLKEEWTCILKYGVDKDYTHLVFEEELLDIQEIESISFSNGNLSKNVPADAGRCELDEFRMKRTANESFGLT
mgnify:CR=1 FL=1